jgi:hypothetical protein
MVIAEEPAQTLTSANAADVFLLGGCAFDQFALEAFVVAFTVIVLDECADRTAERARLEECRSPLSGRSPTCSGK